MRLSSVCDPHVAVWLYDLVSESPTLVKKTHEPSLEFLALRKGERQRRFSALWSVISAAPSTASAFY